MSTRQEPGVALSSTVVVAGDLVSAALPDEVVILEPESGVYYGLPGVGARVWELLQQPVQVSDILARLLEEYDVDPGRCEQDLLALLQHLASKDLIEVQNR